MPKFLLILFNTASVPILFTAIRITIQLIFDHCIKVDQMTSIMHFINSCQPVTSMHDKHCMVYLSTEQPYSVAPPRLVMMKLDISLWSESKSSSAIFVDYFSYTNISIRLIMYVWGGRVEHTRCSSESGSCLQFCIPNLQKHN